MAGVVLAATVAGAAGMAYSQVMPQPVPPTLMTGADLGFRITALKGDTPVGQLVVRVNGEWREVEFAYSLKRVR